MSPASESWSSRIVATSFPEFIQLCRQELKRRIEMSLNQSIRDLRSLLRTTPLSKKVCFNLFSKEEALAIRSMLTDYENSRVEFTWKRESPPASGGI